MDLNNILGVVLAGGKSQRFGQDKSQVKLHDKLLINYILGEIIDVFQETLIIANDSIDYMQSDKIAITKDFNPELIDSSPREGPTIASSIIRAGAGNFPDFNILAKSWASSISKLPVI